MPTVLKWSPIRKHISIVCYSYKSAKEKTSLGRKDLVFPLWAKKVVFKDNCTQADPMMMTEIVEGKSSY